MFESALYFPDLFVKLYFIDKTQILLDMPETVTVRGYGYFLLRW